MVLLGPRQIAAVVSSVSRPRATGVWVSPSSGLVDQARLVRISDDGVHVSGNSGSEDCGAVNSCGTSGTTPNVTSSRRHLRYQYESIRKTFRASFYGIIRNISGPESLRIREAPQSFAAKERARRVCRSEGLSLRLCIRHIGSSEPEARHRVTAALDAAGLKSRGRISVAGDVERCCNAPEMRFDGPCD